MAASLQSCIVLIVVSSISVNDWMYLKLEHYLFVCWFVLAPAEGSGSTQGQTPNAITRLKSQIVDEGQVAVFECQFVAEPSLEVRNLWIVTKYIWIVRTEIAWNW